MQKLESLFCFFLSPSFIVKELETKRERRNCAIQTRLDFAASQKEERREGCDTFLEEGETLEKEAGRKGRKEEEICSRDCVNLFLPCAPTYPTSD